MTLDEAVAALPRCSTCHTPQVGSDCLYCRTMEVEAKLARVSFWGDDEWMQKVASLTIIDRPRTNLHPLGFYEKIGNRTEYTTNVVSRPMVLFKPMMLTVAPECAYMGTLLDVKVGNRSQMVDAQPLPLSLFSPASYNSPEMMREIVGKFQWDTASVAQDVMLSINVSIERHDRLVEIAHETLHGPRPTAFKAIVWGHMIDHTEDVRPRMALVGPEHVKEIEATLKFAELVKQIRGWSLIRG